MVTRNAPQPLPRAPDKFDRNDEQRTREMIDAAIRSVSLRVDNLESSVATTFADFATGPASANDNAIARFDGITGKLLQDSGVTIDDADLLTVNASWTPFDTAVWTGAVGQRIGVDLNATGASFPGDNEFALVVAANTTGPTNSTDRTYKVGILSIAATSDPSDFGSELYRMSVGADTRGYALDGNLTAFIFGGFSGAYFHPGSDGCGRGHESEVNNFGSGEPSIISPYSKFAYHAVAGGDAPATAGLVLSSGEFIANQFYYGIHGYAADYITAFIHLDGAHAVLPTGASGFGTDDPQRMVHAWVADAVTNAISGGLRLTHVSSGTAAAGLGVSIEKELQNASGTKRVAGTLNVAWSDPTNATEDAIYQLNLIRGGSLANAYTVTSLGVMSLAGDLHAVNSVNAVASGSVPTLNTSRTDAHGTVPVGQVAAFGVDSGGNSTVYGLLRTDALSVTDGAEYGTVVWQIMKNGTLTTAMLLSPFGVIDIPGAYYHAGVQVLGARGAAVADPTGGSVVDVEARAQLVELLSRARAHGWIAT